MKLAIRAYVITLILLTLVCAAAGQRRSANDPRNIAPTVGGGGPVAGPTGLFTVYDGQTLRKGEWTISIANTNYDRDPGDVDITDTPLSFQVGLTDKLELFFSTIANRGVKVNSPRNLSGFYLPNSQLFLNGGVFPNGGGLQSAPAIILAPSGPGNGPFEGLAVFRPTGFQPFVNYPYNGGSSGSFGLQFPFFAGPQFGFPAGTNPTMGPPGAQANGANTFPGIGSPRGGILPGIVLQTVTLLNNAGAPVGEGPAVFTISPSYLPSMPFLNRSYGQSSFDDFTVGVKWRWTSNSNPVGIGIMPFWRWYPDKAGSISGFNMMQRGAGPGGSRGDLGVYLFGDARLAKWANFSANAGYVHTSNPKSSFGGSVTLLDLPDEIHAALGLDFPAGKHLQYIFELRTLQYVGSRTPNALERHPLDGLAGIRIFPRRWWGLGAAYRVNFNQQDTGSFDEANHTTVVTVPCFGGDGKGGGCVPINITTNFNGVPPGFRTSTNPSGYIAQLWFGRRQPRQAEVINQAANVDSVTISDTDITLPCPPGFRSTSGQCNDSRTVSVATRASDPENDVLTYEYTVSGGRIIGQGANVQWDLSTAQPGTYTITTGVNDGCGICGKTDTKTITVRECPDCVRVCECPTLGVDGPSGVTEPGQSMTFTATVSGGSQASVTYNWTVSAGTISSGQGTSSITVDTTGLPRNSNVTATVEIGGLDPACECPRTDSETAGIAPPTPPPAEIEIPDIPADQIQAYIDQIISASNQEPNAQIYIINYGTPAEIKARRALLMNRLTFRKFDMTKVTWVDGGNTRGGSAYQDIDRSAWSYATDSIS